MKYLQKLGKSLMLPVSCLPVCGLLMGLGYFLCPAAMQGGEMTGPAAGIGFFLIKAGGALIDNIALLFALGVGVGMSEKNDGTGGLAALASWLMLTNLLCEDTVTALLPAVANDADRLLAFSKVANPFIGILAGIIGSTCYNRFKDTRLPDWLSFFSGKRCVAILAGLLSIAASFALLFVWPLIFSGLIALGKGIANLGAIGAGLYAALNRLLIPTGLHHALNNVFWFDTIGLGDLTHFWAGHTSADVPWSLGMYMSGFFPCMMFGVPGAALAIVRSAKPEKRKAAFGIMLSCAICSFVCGVTEPFTFSFVFLSPLLYVIYALLYGLITILTVYVGFRAGFCFSGGVTDLIFSSSLPAAAKTWLILPLGALSFALFYVVFRVAITRLDLKTPGREDDEEEAAGKDTAPDLPAAKTSEAVSEKLRQAAPAASAAVPPSSSADSEAKASAASSPDKYEKTAAAVLKGIGGAENLLSVDCCVTRLRLEVKDANLVNQKDLRAMGIRGVIRTGRHSVQVVIGTSVQFVAEALQRQLTE